MLVIEAGPSNPKDIENITTPAKAFDLRDSEHDWRYKTTIIDRDEYTRVEKPNTRGKVLGGSNALNYYTWIPGSTATFNEWAEFGGDEWMWAECEPYFSKPATYHNDKKLCPASLRHIGESGPLPVSHSQLLPELQAFHNALERA